MSPSTPYLHVDVTRMEANIDRVVLDAGSKALGAPQRRRDLHPHPLGSIVDVVPNHVCNAVNLAATIHAETDGVLERWPVTARGES